MTTSRIQKALREDTCVMGMGSPWDCGILPEYLHAVMLVGRAIDKLTDDGPTQRLVKQPACAVIPNVSREYAGKTIHTTVWESGVRKTYKDNYASGWYVGELHGIPVIIVPKLRDDWKGLGIDTLATIVASEHGGFFVIIDADQYMHFPNLEGYHALEHTRWETPVQCLRTLSELILKKKLADAKPKPVEGVMVISKQYIGMTMSYHYVMQSGLTFMIAEIPEVIDRDLTDDARWTFGVTHLEETRARIQRNMP